MAAIIAMVIYPPWNYLHFEHPVTRFFGYGWITSPPYFPPDPRGDTTTVITANQVDLMRLLLQCAVVVLFCCGLIFSFRDKTR